MSIERPTLFIGSSKAGLSIAESVQVNLDHECDVTLWSQGVFGLGGGTLETLVEQVEIYDFALLVLTPDDLIESRNVTQPSPRDNVLLELGIFIGGLGRKRTFITYDRDSLIKLPSDLGGVTAATYHLQTSGNLKASLGAACTQMKDSIRSLGIREKKSLSGSIDQSTNFKVISGLLENSDKQFIILMHEKKISFGRENSYVSFGLPYACSKKDRWASHGFFSLDKLCRNLPDADLLKVDLRNNVELTERGHEFAAWLIDNGEKADHFLSRQYTWGELPEGFKDWFSAFESKSP